MGSFFWEAVGVGVILALAFHGWPNLITIHKHYHYDGPAPKNGEGTDDE